jgi:pimeloyl-ACP methyl ester carboxylesterase
MVPFRIFHSELEKHFTVVIWEQRGTGKSYYSGINEESMTIAQFIFDTHELTTYLLNTFHKDKILIVGHSWGSALGLLFVQKYPDLVHAYVGSGQMVNPAQAERISYNFIKNKTIDNEDAQKELMTIDQPFPYLTIAGDEDWFSKLKIHRKWLVKMGGEFYGKNDYSTFMNRKILIAPEYSIFDYIRFGLGSNFSLKVMWPQVMKLDFFSKIPEVSLPVFLLQGRNDYNTPSILVKDYFLKLKAPRKELIWFEESGHHPMYEEPEKFDRILIEKLLPICREDL